MKQNNHTWDSLEIFGEDQDRDFFTSYINNIVIGIENREKSTILFFDNIKKSEINKILTKNDNIKKWKWSIVQEKNWNKACKDFFQPIIINNKIKILPFWEEQSKNYLNIIINPALAFGTGHHETTNMMIKAMLEFDYNNKSILDIGTGSGILSILAKKKGASKIIAVDNDSLTYNNFFENLNLNSLIKEDIDFEIKDCFEIDNFNFDFIFANINSGVLERLIPKINNTNGILIISGILDTDEKSIINLLNQNNKKINKKYKLNEWICFVIEL